MPRVNKNSSTMKQTAYARRAFGAEGKSKTEIALGVGYSLNTAKKATEKIEQSRGFYNAIAKLAADSGNIASQIMNEFKARGFEDFSNRDLIAGLNAIGNAWGKFNAPLIKEENNSGKKEGNRLRTIVLQRVENQTITEKVKPIEVEKIKVEDF